MTIVNNKFKRVRLNQSPYLLHFINGRDHSPCDTLQKILEEKQLISDKEYICLSASPIITIKRFFKVKIKSIGQSTYLSWGLGFSGDILARDLGAKNVTYTDGNGDIPGHLKWRTDILNVDFYDFEYLRKWRIKGKTFNFSNSSQGEIIVIVPNINSLNYLVVELDMKFTPYVNYYTDDIEESWNEEFVGEWRGISIDKLGVGNLSDDFAVSGAIISQEIDEDMMKKLISETPWSLLTKK